MLALKEISNSKDFISEVLRNPKKYYNFDEDDNESEFEDEEIGINEILTRNKESPLEKT